MSEILNLVQEIYNLSNNSNGLDEAILKCKSKLEGMANILNTDLNTKELFVFALLIQTSIDEGSVNVLTSIAKHLDVKKSTILEILPILERLHKQNYIHKCTQRNDDQQKLSDINYYISYQMISSLTKNELHIHQLKNRKALNNIDFIKKIKRCFTDRDYENISQEDLLNKLLELFVANRELSLIKNIENIYKSDGFSLDDTTEFISGVYTNSKYYVLPIYQYTTILKIILNSSEGVFKFTNNDILGYLNNEPSTIFFDEDYLNSSDHPLSQMQLIENMGKGANKSDTIIFSYDNKFLNYFLGEDSSGLLKLANNSLLVMPEDIKSKNLFFNKDLEQQLNQLLKIVSRDNFDIISNKLVNDFKASPGICVLFEGAPGSGKTEYAYQLSKLTNRPIYKVDISHQKSAYIGESEKNIKELFTNYKAFCAFSDVKPIMLLNESDSIFSKRMEVRHSVDQTMNAIQNIILDELDSFEGILIATTNLMLNFDEAFNRRLLMKIRFDIGDVEVRAKIWQSKLSYLSNQQISFLANNYELSPAQIDNISKKIMFKDILGENVEYDVINELCQQEKGVKSQNSIGFNFSEKNKIAI